MSGPHRAPFGPLLHFILRVARRITVWADGRLNRRALAAASADFPPGCKVLMSGECCSAQYTAGTPGVVHSPSSYVVDEWGLEWRVHVEGATTFDGKRARPGNDWNELLCPRGMRRAP